MVKCLYKSDVNIFWMEKFQFVSMLSFIFRTKWKCGIKWEGRINAIFIYSKSYICHMPPLTNRLNLMYSFYDSNFARFVILNSQFWYISLKMAIADIEGMPQADRSNFKSLVPQFSAKKRQNVFHQIGNLRQLWPFHLIDILFSFSYFKNILHTSEIWIEFIFR